MKKVFLIILSVFFLTKCTNFYNRTIEWIESIKIGTDIQTVKNDQPDFIIIGWDKPDTLLCPPDMSCGHNGYHLCYEIKKIKGNNDILNMIHYLEFEDGKYYEHSYWHK